MSSSSLHGWEEPIYYCAKGRASHRPCRSRAVYRGHRCHSPSRVLNQHRISLSRAAQQSSACNRLLPAHCLDRHSAELCNAAISTAPPGSRQHAPQQCSAYGSESEPLWQSRCLMGRVISPQNLRFPRGVCVCGGEISPFPFLG